MLCLAPDYLTQGLADTALGHPNETEFRCDDGFFQLLVAFCLVPFATGTFAQQGFRDLQQDQGFSEPRFQERSPLQATSEAAAQQDIHESLEAGYQLERDQLWSDALVHYEDASRKFPNQLDIQQRLKVVRIQYDLSRRYADSSFVHAARRLGVSDALDLYREVCVKIQSHYVDSPNWQALLQRGIRNLEVALRDSDFRQLNGVQVAEEQIQSFVRFLLREVSARQFTDRGSAEEFVLAMARSGQQHAGVPPVATVLEFVCGATSSLDEYSTFLTPEQLDDVYSQIEGNFVGLGIELKASSGSLLITNVIRGGPADRAGIRAQERIIEVDGKTMQDISTDKAADLLKGEQGSVVQVVMLDPQGSSRRVNVRRERVEVPSVEDVRMLDPDSGIAYLKLTSFQKTTSRDIDAALWKLHRQGMKSLIIDVRGNPGGLLTQSVEIADKFVSEGTIVSTRGRSPREDFDYPAHRTGTWWNVALVVLIDKDSASASEIFAGAIHDHRRGMIVGQRSYGKGSVQGIFPLRTGKAGVRLTTAKFYSPSGRAISNNGVEPDLAVREPDSSVKDANDPVIAAGIEAARQSLATRTRQFAN